MTPNKSPHPLPSFQYVILLKKREKITIRARPIPSKEKINMYRKQGTRIAEETYN